MTTKVEIITLPYQHPTQTIDTHILMAIQQTQEVIACQSYLVGPPTALRAIAGFGEKRVERFGVSILKQLQALKLIHPLLNPYNVKKEQATETQATETPATETQAKEVK